MVPLGGLGGKRTAPPWRGRAAPNQLKVAREKRRAPGNESEGHSQRPQTSPGLLPAVYPRTPRPSSVPPNLAR